MDKKTKNEVEEVNVVALRFISQFSTDTSTDPQGKLVECKGAVYQYMEDIEGKKYDRHTYVCMEDKAEKDVVNKVLQIIYDYADSDEGWGLLEVEESPVSDDEVEKEDADVEGV